MKLELAMTERDKKLLVFLGIFVIIVCFGYWGIRPAVNSMTEMKEERADLENQQDMNELKLGELPLLQEDNDKLEENITTARASYFSMMSSDEVDRYLTYMALEHNLSAYDMDITMPTGNCTLEPYQYSAKSLQDGKEVDSVSEEDLNDSGEAETTEEEEAEETEDSQEEEDEEEEVDNGIYVATVALRLGGEQKDLTQLVNDLSASEQRLRVCSYSYDTKQTVETEEDGTYEVTGNMVLNITLELYMCQE
jgi:hypothetical protein